MLLEEITARVIGPYKILNYNSESRTIDTGKNRFILGDKIKDIPKIGYNYVFKISGNVVNELILMTVDNIVLTDSEILLIKRKNNPYAGYWALPGGFIDPGEKPIISAARELLEETGLNVDPYALTYIGRFDEPYRDPRMEHTYSYAFMLKTDKTKVKAGDDASHAVWIPINRLNSLPLAFDHKNIIQSALKAMNMK